MPSRRTSTSAATSTSGSARTHVFDTFTFGFEETEAGWIWFHAYPFTAETSTFIVECTPETWSALGFDELSSDDSMARLEEIFARHLDGHPLIDQRTGWAVPGG